MTSTDQVRDGFVERLFASAPGTMDVFTVYLGDHLGLYRMLAAHGPLTAGELAERAGIYARYAREWLEQQAATAILGVDDAEKPEEARRFSLSAGHAEALIDPESPYAMAALCRSPAALGGVLPKLVDAGVDPDERAIARARANAQDAGVADRVTFQARDAADPSLCGQYDLAVIVEALHDMSRPVDVLASVRRLLAPGGTLIVADERVADAFHAPAGDTERLFYGYSVLDCLPAGMVSKPSAETGTVMRRSTLERYASTAGFSAVSVLPIHDDFLRFYRLDP